MRTSLRTSFTKQFGSQRRLTRAASAVVESLETRRLLAAFVVNTLTDSVDAANSSTVSLRDAINASNADGTANTITFALSLTASGPGTITLASLGELAIENTVGTTTITGPGAGLLTISGNNQNRVFELTSGVTAAISGLTITHGSAFDGGAILNAGMLTVTNCTVTDNTASYLGGAIYSNNGTLMVVSSTISENSAVNGGGIYNDSNGTLTINNSTIAGNSATGTSNSCGGGLNNSYLATITDSTISGNSSDYGGGIFDGGDLVLSSCTISANSASVDAGGIDGSIDTLDNTIVAGNTGPSPDIDGGVTSGGYNLIGDGSSVTGITNGVNGNQIGTGGSPLDPMLGPLADNDGPTETMTPLMGSPAINSGSNALIPVGLTTDQRGGPFSRTNAAVDVGAVEFNPTVTQRVVNTLIDSSDASGSSTVSLRDAINTAGNDFVNNDFNVYFAPSLTAAGPATITLNTSLGALNGWNGFDTTTINGPGANLLSVSGNDAIGVFAVSTNALAAIDGLTITDGSTGSGAGISNGGTLTLTNCDLTDNTANGSGGGIFNNGTLNIVDCTFSGNTSQDHGGAILNQGTMLTISGSTFANNSSTAYAGAIDNDVPMMMTNSTFSGNSATFGGAIVNVGSATITNCTFNQNMASNTGGAIDNTTGSLTMASCTISGNSSTSGVGGIATFGGTLNNTIVAGNTGPTQDISGVVTSGAFNLIGDGSDVAGIINGVIGNQAGTDDSPIDPELGALANNGGLVETMALLPGSPAIDAGNPTFVSPPTTDARGTGFARVANGRIDIGAYEAQLLHFVVSAQPNAIVGNPVYITVVLLDEFDEPAGGYNGTVHFETSGSDATLPSDTTLNSDGDDSYVAVFGDTGSDFVIEAFDTVNGSIQGGASGTINVIASPTLNTTPDTTTVTLSNSAVTLHDAALLTTGDSETGTITFTLYQGSTLVDTETAPVTGNGLYTTPTGYTLPTSGNVTGTYQWDASYGGDANNAAVSENNSAAEQVVVSPANTFISPAPQPASAAIGDSIADQATLYIAYNPTGTVTFNLYNNPSGTGTPLFSDTESVSGGVATSASYTTTALGTDYWIATYNGDSNNAAIASQAASQPVEITLPTPSISTSQQPASTTIGGSIADQATVSGGNSTTGTVTFYLYNNPLSNGPALFTAIAPLFNGVATSESYIATRSGTDYWVAIYNGDSNHSTSTSDAAGEPVVIGVATPSISTTQQPGSVTVGSSIADQATVSGGDNPTGTVTFKLYNNSNGTGTPLLTDIETLSGGAATSLGISAPAAGTDYWVATYNGDSNNSTVTSGLAAEPVSIAKASPAIATTPSATSQTTDGSALQDTAVLSGGYNETGTITFSLYLGSTLVDTEMATVNGNGSYSTPTGYTLPTTGSVTGTYQWDATYGGDSNNSTISENNSAAEQVVVTQGNQAPTDISLSANSVAENQPSGTTVGTLSTTDPDTGNTFTYTLVSGTGSTDNASFSISNDTLETAAIFTNPAQTSYSIRVRSTDQGGLFTEKTFTVLVPAPAVARLAFVSARANVVAGAAISPALSLHMLKADGTVNTTDKSKVTLSIVSDPTGGKIVGAKPTAAKSGLVTFGKTSFTVAGVYVLRASDGTYAAATTTITVAPAAASKLVFSNVPATLSTGHAFSAQLTLFDKYGNLESGNDDSITLALGKHTKETSLSGVLTGNLTAGTEIFSGLSFSTAGVYSLIATDGGHLTGKSVGTIKVSA